MNNTKHIGITLDNNNSNIIEAFVDSSFGPSSDRKIQSDIMIRCGQGPLLCKSNKQSIVAKSSTESELIAASDSISYLYAIRNILKFLNFEINNRIIYQDNQSTIKLINNNKPISIKSKHIDMRYFFLRDQIKRNIQIKYCSTHEMLSDILTKGVPTKQFITLRDKLINYQEH